MVFSMIKNRICFRGNNWEENLFPDNNYEVWSSGRKTEEPEETGSNWGRKQRKKNIISIVSREFSGSSLFQAFTWWRSKHIFFTLLIEFDEANEQLRYTVYRVFQKFVPILNCILRKAFNALGKCKLIQVRNLSK